MREPAAREPQASTAGDRESPAREPSVADAIAEAARRLDRAMTRLEAQVGAGLGGPDPFDPDNVALAAELAAARAREQALKAAAEAASQALGRAADEVRLVLSGNEVAGDEIEDDDMTAELTTLDLHQDTMAEHDPSPPKDPAA